MQGRRIQRFGFGTRRQGWQRRRKEEGACPGSAWELNGKVGHVRVGFSSRRRPLRSSPFDGRGAHPRIWRESCRSPLKFAQRRQTHSAKAKWFTATLVTSEGRKGLIGQPARHQGGTREAGKDHLDSLGGTRDARGRQEGTNWTACNAPGRQERTNWTALEAPGRHQRGTGKDQIDSLGGTREAGKENWTACEAARRRQGGRKGAFGQPGRHQGDTREAGKYQLDSLGEHQGGTRKAPGRQERIK